MAQSNNFLRFVISMMVIAGGIFAETGQQHWDYGEHGPETWGKLCRHGKRQSPIDIRTSQLEFALMDELVFGNYNASGAVQVKNNGHTVEISGFDKWAASPHISGGGLSAKYVLSQFHFHWSTEHERGSEHTVNALHYPMELHLVHVKSGLTLQEALLQPDGVAVIGIFYYLDAKNGTSMANLETALKKVVKSEASTTIANYTAGVHLPPSVGNFYRYMGSLTTPECSEAVVWTVLADPMPMLKEQLELLRAIHDSSPQGHRLGENVRPVQPLNGRIVQFRASALNRKQLCKGEAKDRY